MKRRGRRIRSLAHWAESLEPRLVMAGPGDDVGDTRAAATPLAFAYGAAGSLADEIGRPEDIDLLRLDLKSGDRVEITLESTATGQYPFYGVLRAFGETSAVDASQEHRLNFTAAAAGSFHVGVSGLGNDAYNPDLYDETLFGFTGSYRLTYVVTAGSTAPPNDPPDAPPGGNTPPEDPPPNNEPPGSPALALPPSPSPPIEETSAGELTANGEIDNYPLSFVTKGWLDAQVLDAPSATLSLLDASGTAIATSSAGRLTQHVAPGSYTLSVRSTANERVDYRLVSKVTTASSPLEDFLTGDGIAALATGDLTGDGLVDAVVANELEGTLRFLIGLGDGTFAPQEAFAIGATPAALVANDLTGDGRLDLAVALGNSGRIALYTGGANGWFNEVRELITSGPATALAAGDFDGDGVPDLAVAVSGVPTIEIVSRLQQTTPTRQVLPIASTAVALTSGDLNSDGRQDLVASLGEANQVVVLQQNAAGTFTPQSLSIPGQPSEVAVGDFDGDGDIDLAVGLALDGNVALARRAVDGSYAIERLAVDLDRKVSSAGSALQTVLHAADFNGDQRLDLAVANTFSREVAILQQDSAGMLSPAHRTLIANTIVALDAADLSGDGRLDLIAANNDAATAGVAVRLGRGNGSFQQDARLPVGTDPHALAAADFNSDGRIDLASTSFAGVTIQLGAGDGAFAAPLRIAADQPQAIIAGDFNRDGRPDLAATFPFEGADSRVAQRLGVWLGLGDGTFRDAVYHTVGELPLDLSAADFNGDGLLDLATANGISNDVTVLLGAGDGTFSVAATLAAGAQPSAIVTADLDGDGTIDLATTNESADSVTLWRGAGNGQFTAWATLATGEAPSDLLAADFDGDGRIDLVTADHVDGTLSWFYQDATGAFPRSETSVGEAPRSLALLPAANGQLPQVAITHDDADRLTVWESNAARQWSRAAEYATGRTPIAVVAGDMNQDVRPDLAVLNAFTNDITLLMRSGAEFRAATIETPSLTEGTPTFADINGDSALDSFVVRQSGEILVRMGRSQSPGTFDAPLVVNPGRAALAIEIIDTASGPRLAALDRTGERISLYRIAVNGRAELESEIETLSGAMRLAAGDLNADGLDDLAVAGDDGQVQLLFATSNAGWTTRGFTSGARSPAQLAILDVDGRAGSDLILADSAAGEVRLFLNDGSATFAAPLVYRVGVGPYEIAPQINDNLAALQAFAGENAFVQYSREGTSSIVFGDFDGDALPDLIALNAGSNTLSMLAGAGANGFGAPRIYAMGDRPMAAAVGDFNGDGRSDLAVLLAGEGQLAIYLGDGSGGFDLGASYPAGNLPRGLTALDIDRDGLLDLVVGNAFGDLLTFHGRGDGTFAAYERSGSEIPLAVADVDGDGLPEFIVANPALDRISVQQTDGAPTADGTLTAREIFEQQRAAGLLAPGAVEMADLNGDGRADMLVANSGGNELLVYLGRGDGTFDPVRSFYAGTNPAGITLSDINADGRIDVVVANAGSNDVSILLGDANELLRPGPRLAVGNAPVASQAGDFNGDGQIDLLVANSGADNVSLLLGVGGGFFDDQQALVYPTGADPRTLLVGEFDGRAGNDLVTVNARGGSLTFYSNFLTSSLGATTIATGGLRPTSAVARDLNADGRLDLVVANNLSGSLSLLMGGDSGLSLSTVIAELGFDRPSSLELIDFGSETGLKLLVTHEGDEQPRLFTPKDFLPRETDSIAPARPNSGLLLTLFQAGFKAVASSVIALPTLAPGAAEFLTQLLGNDARSESNEGQLPVAESQTLAGQLRQAAELVFDSLEKSFAGVIAAWNVTFQDDSTTEEWLAGAEAFLEWLGGDGAAQHRAAEGAALATITAAVARRLDPAAADAILAENEPLPLSAQDVAPLVEVEPLPLPDEPARAMPDAITTPNTPITPAALEQPLRQAPPEALPPGAEVRPLDSASPPSAWAWRVWGVAVALGCAGLGAGGVAARRRWSRRDVETLGVE